MKESEGREREGGGEKGWRDGSDRKMVEMREERRTEVRREVNGI